MNRLAPAIAAFVSAAALGSSPCAAERARALDIPAQDAAGALRELGRQTGFQILFPFDAVAGRRSPAVEGALSPLQAAERLAGPLGLSVKALDDRTLSFAPLPPPPARARKEPPTPRPGPAAPVLAAVVARPEPPGLLEAVLVTASRRAELLNEAPISLTAATDRMLRQQGVRQAADMAAVAPALMLNQLTPGLANVAIRGITDTGSGAATTGFYLDDTPLQKRNAGGTRNGSGNGTPLPPLFDIERVEVLRGPQGTLFGSGSEGGTIRYISTQPDLSRTSSLLRAEVSTTARGEPSGELGFAFGTPVVRDRLAVRIALYQRTAGGFLDYVDPYSGSVRFEDANRGRTRLMRLAAALVPAPGWKATLALTSSSDHWDSATSSYTPDMKAAIVTPTQCFNTADITPERPQNNPAPVPCDAPAVTFVRPGQTYGPYLGLGPGRTLLRDRIPSTTTLNIPSLTIEHEGRTVALKAITSLIRDRTRFAGIDNLSQVRDSRSNARYGPIYIPRGLTLAADYPDAWRANGHFYSRNAREGLSQELRIASHADARPATWVAGLFYSNLKTRQQYDNVYEGLEQLSRTLYGISAEQRYGVPAYRFNGGSGGFDHKDQTFSDVEFAGFGQVDYWIDDRLRLTAGLRVSRLGFKYVENHWGPASGFNTPTPANGGGPNAGVRQDTPVAPRFGVLYRSGERDILYLTLAKGFRAGGVNANLPMTICGPGLSQYGLQSSDVPATYRSDRVWSYEAGGKFRVADGRVQLNASAYRVDWRNAQLTVDVGNNCGIPFISNAGAAHSQGLEVEAQVRVSGRLSADMALSLNDVRYTEDAIASNSGSTPLIVALKDQRLAIPPATLRLGARYDARIAGFDAYARADWFYAKGYDHAAQQTFGLPAYAPDAVIQDSGRLNARIGFERDGMEISLSATNLLNSSAGMITGGRSGCALASAGGGASCATYATYNPFFAGAPAYWPRQVGLQLAWRR